MKIIYDNLFDTATVTASEANASFPSANLKLLATTDEWRSVDATGAKTIIIDMGSAKAASGIALIGNNYTRTLSFTGATLEANSSDSWSGGQTAIATLSVDSAEAIASAIFTEQTFRYWRISLTGVGSYLGVSNVFLGKAFGFTVNGIDQEFSFDEQDLSRVIVSETGRRFIDEVTVRVKSFDLSVRTMDKTEMGEWQTIVRNNGKRKQFYMIIEENELIMTNKDVLSGMFMFNSWGPFEHVSFGYWDSSFSVSEVI